MAQLTLEDVGRLAGVSRSTVSRVINGQGVSDDVRRRVEQVVAQTGYTPNPAGRSLASSRTGLIGLAVPSGVHALFEDPYYGRLLRGATRAATAAGATLSLFILDTEEEELALHRRIAGGGLVDGVVLPAARRDDRLLELLAGGDLPHVVVGRPEPGTSTTWVDVDNVGGARSAATHLVRLGHRRIGFLGAPTTTTAGLDRARGFREGLTDAGRDLLPELHVEGDFTAAGGQRAMRRLLAAGPDAVFVASDTMALGALRAIAAAGLRVPQDIAVVGFDDFPTGAVAEPPLTTVHQPVVETAERAVRLLLDLVDGTTRPHAEVLPTRLVVRDSCGATSQRTT